MFVFIQILGGIFGYKWGFAGKQSKAAYLGLGRGRYATYDDVLEHKNTIIDEAQARLEDLQQKLEFKNANYGGIALKTHKTFEDFLYEHAEGKHESLQKHATIGTHTSTTITSTTISNATNALNPIHSTVSDANPLLPEHSISLDLVATAEPNDLAHIKAQLAAELAALNKQKQHSAELAEIAELKRQLAEAKKHV
jgi:hypothetical protein